MSSPGRSRRARYNPLVAKPFLKWAGGKARLAPLVAARAPTFRRYHEPFLGGGAVFFALRGERAFPATLADGNAELIEAYTAVRDGVDALIARLRPLAEAYAARDRQERAALYYEVRQRVPDDALGRAARLIFLNKTCYNGLYRVNREGRFNVPHGRYREPRILDEATLRDASCALQGADLRAVDFAEALAAAEPGDFVYLDPPYQPLSATASFTAYTSADFGPDDQRRLADAFAGLTERGAAAVLSNSDHPEIRALYEGRGYALETVPMGRAINSNGARRASIEELLVSNLSVVGAGESSRAV